MLLAIRQCALLGLVLLFSFLSPFRSSIAADDKASRLYEDALARFEKNDTAGAIIQLKNALQQDPQMLAAHILLGRAYLSNAQPDAAQESFGRATRLGVDPSEVAVYLAQAYLNQGKARELLERFPPESAGPSQRGDLLVVRGKAYWQLGNLEAAERSFADARAASPRFVPAYLAQADLLFRQGKAGEAMKLVDSALVIEPDSPAAWYLKGSIYHSANVPVALENYAKALGFDPNHTAARVARASLLLNLGRDAEVAQDVEYFRLHNPKEPRANYLRSIYFTRRGDHAATREALADIIGAIDPIPTNVLMAQAPELLFIGGLAHHGLDQFEEARKYLERFLQVNPGHVGARKLLGSILIAQRNYPAAVDVLDLARQQAPNDPQVLALLSNAFMGRGRPQIANRYLEQALELSRGAPDMQATLGLNLIQTGQQEAGLRQLEGAFEKRPQDGGVGAALALLYLQRGENRRAAEVAKKMVQSHPADPNALNLLGVTLGAAGDQSGARAAYERALKLEPTFRSARLNLGRLEAVQGNHAAAREKFLGLLKEQPKDVQAMYEMGRVEDGAGRTDDALRWLEKAHGNDRKHVPSATLLTEIYLRSGQPTKALETAKGIALIAPPSVDALSALSRAYAAMGDDREARATLERMSSLAQLDPNGHYWIAKMQLSVNNPDGAVKSLSAALTGRPDYPDAEALLSDIELSQGKVDAAEARAKALVARHPELGVGHRLLADVMMAQGRTEEGIRGYQKALSKDPTADMARRLFQAYIRSGDIAGGVQFMEGWVHNHPGDPIGTRALAEGYLRAGNLPAARAQYEGLLRVSGEDPAILNNLANILAQQGDPRALEFAEQAHRLAPQDAATQDTLGWLLLQRGQTKAALRQLREARLRAPRDPEIRYHLAAALARSGRRDEALSEVSSLLRDHTTFAGAQDARALLEQLSSR